MGCKITVPVSPTKQNHQKNSAIFSLSLPEQRARQEEETYINECLIINNLASGENPSRVQIFWKR